MGLKKEQKLSSGFTASYWSVQNAQINYSAREVSFTILGYKDEQTYRSGGAQASARDVRMRNEEFDQHFPRDTEDNFCTQCYRAAMAKEPLFRDAERI